MAVIPTLPTDNLYKFLALFGLVLFVFGIFFPEDRVARSSAEQREAERVWRVAKVRLDRKNAELREALKQIQDKLAEQARNKQQLDEAAAKLQAKGDFLVNSLTEEAKRSLKSKAVKDLIAQTKALDPEYQALDEKIRQNTEAIKKTNDDIQRLRPRQAELAEESQIEIVNVETFNKAIEELTYQIKLWFSLSIGSMTFGFILMLLGFQLWYKKVQVHQDAILRKQAGDIRADKTE